MIGLLALQLITVERQRRIAARQEVRARESLDYVRQRGEALLQQGSRAVPRIGDGLARADRLVRELARTDSPEAIAEAGRLAQRLQDADLAGRVDLIARVVPMLVDIAADIESLTREGLDVARETSSDVEVLKTETLRFQQNTLGASASSWRCCASRSRSSGRRSSTCATSTSARARWLPPPRPDRASVR